MNPQAYPAMQSRNPENGFSLIELLVGMTISMIMFLVISYVFVNFEQQKRITTVSSDAQSSGLMAMLELEQAARSAGAGIVSEDSFSCLPASTKSYYYKAAPPTTTAPVPGYGQFFAPVVITNGAGNVSDTLELRVGVPVANSAPTQLAEQLPKSSTEMKVRRGTGFPVGSVLLLVNGNECAVFEVTSIPDAQQPNRMSIAPGAGSTWNPTAAYKVANAWPDFPKEETYVYAPGTITFRTYTVNASGQLQVVSAAAGAASTTEVLVGDVVRFHAQYGIASGPAADGIQNWVEPVTGGVNGDWAPADLDANKVKRIRAIRLAIVVRAPKLEAANVTNTCTNNAGVNNGPCAWEDTAADKAPLIDLSADANWRKYRYRVFQTIIPIRNTISSVL